MRLTDSFDEVVLIDSKEYNLNMAFDNILRFYELYEDEEVTDSEKIEFMFQMLVEDSESVTLSLNQKKDVVEQIIVKYIATEEEKIDDANGESANDNDPDDAGDEKKVKEYDLTIDAGLIFSSFMYDYRIDLFEQQGRLHWNKFIALLSGLSEKSPFMKVIQIRTCEVPPPDKHNSKERKKLLNLKRRYALDKQEQSMQSGLSKAATFLRSKSKVKEKVGE